MRVFVTGASGFIGSAITRELIDAGHRVLGLARSDAAAASIAAAGVDVHRGSLEDLESLSSGAAISDAVIHTAFDHDFSKFVANCEADRRVIEAMGSVLAGSDKLLIITSGTGMGDGQPGRLRTEDDPPASPKVVPRAASEEAAAALAARGVRVAVMRLPQVHDTRKQGLVTYAIQVAREKGVAAYVGDGRNRWPAAHRLDTARLYRLALERTDGNATYHAVAEEGVRARDIAETIGRGLKVPAVSIPPERAAEHFGWLGHFIGWDIAASSAKTRETLGWTPTGPSLLSDLEKMRYFDT